MNFCLAARRCISFKQRTHSSAHWHTKGFSIYSLAIQSTTHIITWWSSWFNSIYTPDPVASRIKYVFSIIIYKKSTNRMAPLTDRTQGFENKTCKRAGIMLINNKLSVQVTKYITLRPAETIHPASESKSLHLAFIYNLKFQYGYLKGRTELHTVEYQLHLVVTRNVVTNTNFLNFLYVYATTNSLCMLWGNHVNNFQQINYNWHSQVTCIALVCSSHM